MTIAKKIGLSLLDDNLKLAIEDTAGIAPVDSVADIPSEKAYNYYRVVGDNADRHKIYEWNETNAQYELLGIDDRVSLAWVELKDKPTEFTPSTHTHDVADIENNTLTWGSLTDKPTEFTPASHEHNSSYYQKSEVDAIRNSKNLVINPDMDIWQRGSSFTVANNTGAYTADRHYIYNYGSGVDVNVEHCNMDEVALSGIRVTLTADSTLSERGLYTYTVENETVEKYAGKQMVISAYVRGIGNTDYVKFRVCRKDTNEAVLPTDTVVYDSDNISISADVSRVSACFTMPTVAEIGDGAVGFILYPINQNYAGDGYEITGVCLEEGSTPSGYKRTDPEQELRKAMRYCYMMSSDINMYRMVRRTSSALVFYPITPDMRAPRSIINPENFKVYNLTMTELTGFTFAVSQSSGRKNQFWVGATKTAHGITDAYLAIGAYAGFDCEL